MVTEPVGADPLRHHHHPGVGQVLGQPQDHRRVVLEAKRPGVEEDGYVGQSLLV